MFNDKHIFIFIYNYIINILFIFVYFYYFYDKDNIILNKKLKNISIILIFFIISGIPPLSIFIFKFFVFKNIIKNINSFLSIFIFINNTVLLYLYFNTFKNILNNKKSTSIIKKSRYFKQNQYEIFFSMIIFFIFNIFFVFYFNFFVLVL